MESHWREASSPRALSNGSESNESPAGTLGRAFGPLADPYRMGLGPPLGLPVNSSPEMSCSLPSEGSMALSPLPPCGKATKGVL
jgi:hypothetical protein